MGRAGRCGVPGASGKRVLRKREGLSDSADRLGRIWTEESPLDLEMRRPLGILTGIIWDVDKIVDSKEWY